MCKGASPRNNPHRRVRDEFEGRQTHLILGDGSHVDRPRLEYLSEEDVASIDRGVKNALEKAFPYRSRISPSRPWKLRQALVGALGGAFVGIVSCICDVLVKTRDEGLRVTLPKLLLFGILKTSFCVLTGGLATIGEEGNGIKKFGKGALSATSMFIPFVYSTLLY